MGVVTRLGCLLNQCPRNSDERSCRHDRAHRRQGAPVRARGVAGGKGAKRQDLHHPHPHAGERRGNRCRISRLHENGAGVRLSRRGPDHPLPRHARSGGGRLRSRRRHRLLRRPRAPHPGRREGTRHRAERRFRRHPPGKAASPGLARRRRADEPARGLSVRKRAPPALSLYRRWLRRCSARSSGEVPDVPTDPVQNAAGQRRIEFRAHRLHAARRRHRAGGLRSRGPGQRADRRGAGRRCTRPRRASRCA